MKYLYSYNLNLSDYYRDHIVINLLSLVTPIEMRMFYKSYPWQLGELGCKFASIICELVTHVLIITMIAFSLER